MRINPGLLFLLVGFFIPSCQANQTPADGGDQETDNGGTPDDVLPAEVLFFDSFEGSVNAGGTHGWTRILAKDCDWNPADFNAEINQSTRFDYVTQVARFGDTALRISVLDGDQVVNADTYSGNERAELSRRYLTDTGEGVPGDERWYGLSFLIDETMPAIPSPNWSILTQFLKENNSSAPYPNPTVSVIVKYADGSHYLQVYNREYKNGSWEVETYNVGSLPANTWTDLAFHIRWSLENDGFWEVWRDGELVAGNANTVTLPGIDHPTFQKIGAYRSDAAETFRLYYDGYWMGLNPPPYAR